MFRLTDKQLCIALPLYGFLASVLPVWLLLCPRDYLSSYMKIGVISLLAIGIILVHPELKMPAITRFVHGGGPIVPGPVWPFVMITIACGAVSGFHSLIATGTTPKMIEKESQVRLIGYGAMLVEGFVALMALIAASSLHPGDYFAINAKPEAFATLGYRTVELDSLSRMVRETLVGRTGGAVSLAVGMARVFSGLPGAKHLMAYWYHFAIMFEALFILTTVDTGTRVARFIVQEIGGKVAPKLRDGRWMPGVIVTSGLVCLFWGYLVYNGDITTIWPMFGVSNQLLASVALAIGTTMILRTRKPAYALTTLLPMLLMFVTTVTAGIISIFKNYLPMHQTQGYLNAGLTAVMVGLAFLITADCAAKWAQVLQANRRVGVAVAKG